MSSVCGNVHRVASKRLQSRALVLVESCSRVATEYLCGVMRSSGLGLILMSDASSLIHFRGDGGARQWPPQPYHIRRYRNNVSVALISPLACRDLLAMACSGGAGTCYDYAIQQEITMLICYDNHLYLSPISRLD